MKYSDMKQAVKLLDKEWNLGKKGIEGHSGMSLSLLGQTMIYYSRKN